MMAGRTALESLEAAFNQLSSLDITGCTSLRYLICCENQLTSLDVSDCSALIIFNCHTNPLTNLDISKNINLESIYIAGMPSLYEVCVWTDPFPPDGVEVIATGSPNVFFTTNCVK
jgi:Leucine-rich repeat (LRR) protein